MKRKIIKQGVGGNTIFLPVKWVRENNLGPGDEIDIDEAENRLIITTEGKEDRKKGEFRFTSEDETFIRMQLDQIYRLGYDWVKIKTKDEEQRKHIKNVVAASLLGFEVTQEEKDTMVIESVTEPSDEKQDALFRRMFLIVGQSFETIAGEMETGKYNSKDQIVEMAFKIGMYLNFLRRNITKKRFTDRKVMYYWEVYNKVSWVQSAMKYMYPTLDQKIPAPTIKIFRQLQKNLEEIDRAYHRKDLETIQAEHTKLKELMLNTIVPKMKKTKGTETAVLFYCGHMSRLIYSTAASLTALLLT